MKNDLKGIQYIGYGTNNKGQITSASSWARLNGGKKPTQMQMKMLKIRPYTKGK